MQSQTAKRLSGGLILLSALLLPLGCQKSEEARRGGEAADSSPRVPVVTVVMPERKTIRQFLEQPGHLEAFEYTPIYAKIPGYIRSIPVEIDDEVKQGEVLVELAVPELKEEVEQKAAMVAQAEAEVKQAEQALKAAAAKLETAEALVREAQAGRKRAQANYERWESEYKRMASLVRDKTIDEQTRDETQNQFKAADAARTEVEARVLSAEAVSRERGAQLAQTQSDLEAAEARQRVAEADHRRVEALWSYTRIKAPYAGVITQRNKHTGDFVQPPAGEKSTPLVVLERRDKLRIVIEVPETEAALINKGAEVQVRIPSQGGQVISEPIKRTAWSLETRVRTLRVEMDRQNQGGKLRPGSYVHASIPIEHKDVWTLPVKAVLTQADQSFAFRVHNGRVHRLPLLVGLKSGGAVEVIGPEGWNSGDPFVMGQLSGLQEDQEVEIETTKK